MSKHWSRKRGASVLTPRRVKQICNALQIGVPLEYASSLAKIDISTLNRARAKSKALCAAIKGAEGTLIQGLTSIILVAAKNGQWTAAAWLLERRWPQLFAKTERHEVSGPGGKPLPGGERPVWVEAVREALGFTPRRTITPAELAKALPEAGVVDAQIIAAGVPSGGDGPGPENVPSAPT
jgi:hypothetical protein